MNEVKNILDNINTLDGFMTEDELTSSLLSANNDELIPPICSKYNGPERIEDEPWNHKEP
jgi:hypothetical protein